MKGPHAVTSCDRLCLLGRSKGDEKSRFNLVFDVNRHPLTPYNSTSRRPRLKRFAAPEALITGPAKTTPSERVRLLVVRWRPRNHVFGVHLNPLTPHNSTPRRPRVKRFGAPDAPIKGPHDGTSCDRLCILGDEREPKNRFSDLLFHPFHPKNSAAVGHRVKWMV